MADAADDPSLSVYQAFPLLSAFTSFLTVAIHSLLYHRRLYPPETFLATRAYNLPVRQSRHPDVCAWISDAVASLSVQLKHANLDRVVLVVHAPRGFQVLERWVFDVARFPRWGRDHDLADAGDFDQDQDVNWADVNEALRGALRRVAYAAEKTPPPPEGCSFTIAVELRDQAPAPVTIPQEWIPSEPDKKRSKGKETQKQVDADAWGEAASMTPIRSVQAGPLFFECWVEQPSPQSADDSRKTRADTQDTPTSSS